MLKASIAAKVRDQLNGFLFISSPPKIEPGTTDSSYAGVLAVSATVTCPKVSLVMPQFRGLTSPFGTPYLRLQPENLTIVALET